MSINDSTPLSVDDNDVPFSGPNPQDDQTDSTRPEADGDVDEEELYQEGLESAAGMGEDPLRKDSNEPDLPDGFHVEE